MKCTTDAEGNMTCTGSGGGGTATSEDLTKYWSKTNKLPGGAGLPSNCETCAQKRQSDKYLSDIKSASSQALENLEAITPGIGELPSYGPEDGGSVAGLEAVAKLRDETINILRSRGFEARTTPDSSGVPYPQMIVVWKYGEDSDATTYRVTAGGAKISEAINVAYCGGHETFSGVDIIPVFCSSGGTVTPPPTPPVVNNARIDSIFPTTVISGVTTITISGINLTNQVSFYDSVGERHTTLGMVNPSRTQTTVGVPVNLPNGNTTVRIYQGNDIWSNGISIVIE
jgi:hypothetical protein